MIVPENNLLCKVINGEKVLAASYSQIDTFIQCPYNGIRLTWRVTDPRKSTKLRHMVRLSTRQWSISSRTDADLLMRI